MPRTAANTTNPAPASDPALRPGTMAGTGFFVNDTTLVTAGAVLDRCARLALRDGSALDMIAGDGAAGLAVLTLGRGTGTWLPVDPKARPGAGQPVIVVGYPDGDAPFSTRIDGHVTGAAAAGRTALSVPSNAGLSGAPVLDERGLVAGVIVPGPGKAAIIATGQDLARILSARNLRFDSRSRWPTSEVEANVRWSDTADAVVALFCL